MDEFWTMFVFGEGERPGVCKRRKGKRMVSNILVSVLAGLVAPAALWAAAAVSAVTHVWEKQEIGLVSEKCGGA